MEEIDAASGRTAGPGEEETDRRRYSVVVCVPERAFSVDASHERGGAAVAFHRAEARRSRG
jgi:hypothetical protein